MFHNFGLQELILLLVIVLIIFGPKNLPKIGQALGKSIKEFRKASRDIKKEFEDEEEEDDEEQREYYTETKNSRDNT